MFTRVSTLPPQLQFPIPAFAEPSNLGVPSVQVVNDPTEPSARKLEALKESIGQFFVVHVKPENLDVIRQIVTDRAEKILAMGHTPEMFEANMQKAYGLDQVAQAAIGSIRAIPFAGASVLTDLESSLFPPEASPALKGAISGLVSGVMDTGLTSIMNRATRDPLWMRAPADKLEPFMAEALACKQPSLGRKSLEASVASQTYTVRNVLRMVVAASVTATQGAESARRWDTGVTAIGGLIANAGFATKLHQNERRDHRAGPAFLLGRVDWEDQYKALSTTDLIRGPITNGSKVMGRMALSCLTDTLNALGTSVQASSMVKNVGALGGGFAATSVLREMTRNAVTRQGLPPAVVAAADHAVNTVASAAVFSAWATADVMTSPFTEKAVEFIHESVPKGLGQLSHRVGDGATSGADSVARRVNQLFNRRPVGDRPRGDGSA